ncbi:helix-turn-helix domain-containing protein [Vagococcus sp. BWB3-3]|uniref:Helix-turn-helix domain-containing protein n=1 Tax=Vagococcus allomyrinae TaxID=2794353 RepID=A0A940SSU5_9ENTE|nr:helix-turn-helix domain-containing protein [Vagococcus allomyrinae]
MLEILLDKNTVRKLNFFRTLEESPSLSERAKIMMDKLEMSEYLLTKTIQELNHDFNKFNLTEVFNIYTRDDEIILEESFLATSDYLEECYLGQSHICGIIESIFLNEFISVNDYAVNHFISYPIIYRELKHRREALKTLGVTITKQFQFFGKERDIRNLLTLLFSKIYKRDFSLYEGYRTKATEQINQLERIFDTTFSEKVKTELMHQLCVSQSRLKTTAKTVADEVSQEHIDFFFPMMGFFSEELRFGNLRGDDLRAELTLVYSELLRNGYGNQKLFGKLRENSEIHQRSQYFVGEVVSKLKLDITKIDVERLYQELDIIHFQVVYLPKRSQMIERRIDVSYFEDTYNTFFQFTRHFILESQYHPEGKGIWESAIFVFYQYILLLITVIPPDLYSSPIYIYVDFSLGKLYNDYIIKNMSILTSLNIVVESHLSDQTMLILTDTYLEEAALGVASVVWLEPPRARDWSVFATKILEIQKSES